MKIISFNVLKGGLKGISFPNRLSRIIQVIKQSRADIVGIQEGCTWDRHDFQILKSVSKQTGYPFFEISIGNTTDSGFQYNTIFLSKYVLKSSKRFSHEFRNSALEVTIDADFGPLALFNVHLTPKKEIERKKEIDIIIKRAQKYNNSIILGDLNSLSSDDYNIITLPDLFNEKQKSKFLTEGEISFFIIPVLQKNGYTDVFALKKKNTIMTVPTESNVDIEHETPLRLDYIWVSKNITKHIRTCGIIKNKTTEHASDHYPIFVTT